MPTYTLLRIGAIAMFAAGVAILLLAILLPKIGLYPVGLVIAGIGTFGFYGSHSLKSRAGRSHDSGKPLVTTSVANRVDRGAPPSAGSRGMGGFMGKRPVLQMVWFGFVGVVAMTLGVISIINHGPKDQNLAGGILAVLIGLGCFHGFLLRVPEAAMTTRPIPGDRPARLSNRRVPTTAE